MDRQDTILSATDQNEQGDPYEMAFDKLTRRDFFGRTLMAGAIGGCGMAAMSCATTLGGENPTWQVGCYTRPWAKHDYRVALDAIAEAGFKYAGLMTTNTKRGLIISVDTPPEEAAIAVPTAGIRESGISCTILYPVVKGPAPTVPAS